MYTCPSCGFLIFTEGDEVPRCMFCNVLAKKGGASAPPSQTELPLDYPPQEIKEAQALQRVRECFEEIFDGWLFGASPVTMEVRWRAFKETSSSCYHILKGLRNE